MFQVFIFLTSANLKTQLLVSVIDVSMHENFLFYVRGMKCQKGRNEDWCSLLNATNVALNSEEENHFLLLPTPFNNN